MRSSVLLPALAVGFHRLHKLRLPRVPLSWLVDVKRVCKSVRYCGLLSVAGAKNFLGFVIFLKNGDFMRKSTCRNDR